jgi:uncharacterized phage protein gp47/JayE
MAVNDPPSFQDFYDTGRTEAITKQPNLTILEGDVSDFIISAGAAMADHSATYAEDRFAATFLDSAQGDDLTTLGDDHWNIQRKTANAATGIITFTRANDGAGSGTIYAGSVVATLPDFNGTTLQYAVDADHSITVELTISVSATAVVSGLGGNVAAHTVDSIVTNLWDSSFTVDNASGFAGGADAESDEDYRTRIRNFPSTIRRGTISALEYGAIQVSGVATAIVVEEADPSGAVDYAGNPLLTGIVDLYVCDAEGNSSPTMVSAVKAEIELWRCAGILVQVYGGQLLSLPAFTVALTIRVSSGITVSLIQANVKAAIVARVARLHIGEDCSLDIIKQAALNVDTDNILQVSISGLPSVTSATNIDGLRNQLIRVDPSVITVS